MSDLPIARLDHLCRIAVVGRHRARFLHAMTTAEIVKLTPGEATFALVATANGRHVGQLRIEVEADALSMICDATSLEPILTTLKKHKVADDVRFGEPIVGEATLAVYLDGATDGLESLLGPLPAAGRFVDGDVRITAWDATRSELGRPTLHVRGTIDRIATLEAALLAQGATLLSAEAWEAARIARGWPRDGVDLGPEDLALASDRLIDTVSWSKGCFLGQEVFVMARDRGEVPKRLRHVAFAGDVGDVKFPTSGAALALPDGKSAGVLGSSAGGLGLAILKRRAAEPGTGLVLADGRSLVVQPLG